MIKLTNDKAAMVDTKIKWIPVTTVIPPRGAKVLLINRKFGVAVLGPWSPDEEWTHWHPLPTFLTEEDDA